MQSKTLKTRFIRSLPGRIRIEIYKLKYNKNMANLILDRFSQAEGIYQVSPSISTGRALITFDINKTSLHNICKIIQLIEEQVTKRKKSSTNNSDEKKELIDCSSSVVSRNNDTVHRKKDEGVPLPLALSVVGLGAFGIKQLFMGRSALARSPGLFYVSGALSVVTGYPFLKRGFKKMVASKKVNSDLVLGVGTLALALARENIVVLAGLSLLNYLNWKRSQANINEENEAYKENLLSPEIKAYSEKQSKWGMIFGGATWAFTRNPLRGMAVLLAANPKPAVSSAEYAWRQGDLVARERGYVIPSGGSLSQLSRTKTIVLDDTSRIFQASAEGMSCISQDEHEGQVWCTVASLIEKSEHVWKEEVVQRAAQTGRTLRKAFEVQVENEGIKGEIQGITSFFGSKDFAERNGVDISAYELEAKRLEKEGFQVQYVAKNKECLGLLVGSKVTIIPEFKEVVNGLHENKWSIGVLQNSLHVNRSILSHYGVDDSWQQGDAVERVKLLRSNGEEVLFATDQNTDFPSISFEEIKNISQSTAYANRINMLVNEHFRAAKVWNVVGEMLAVWSIFTAPVIALFANALSLTFLSRAKRMSEKIFSYGELSKMDSSQPKVIPAKQDQIPWYTFNQEKVMNRLQVEKQYGLSNAQVNMRKEEYGMNQIEPKPSVPWIVSFMGQFKEFTSLILLGAAGLSVISGGWFDGLAMGTILVVNAIIGTLQERKAEKVVEALNQFRAPICKVIREEAEIEISSSELVPGDIVCLEAGDRVPADLRVVNSWNLEINEAMLTGESLPVEKKADAVLEECSLAERNNMLFMGTSVTRGKAVAIVVETGMRTEMGYMISLMKGEETEPTPLQQKVTSISKTFIKGAFVAGGLVLVAGLLRGLPITQMITTSVALTASAVPEGLPIMITIALSAGIFRMQKQNALVRKLSSLETLGRTTVICSDKTGTLTKNEMTVKVIATPNRLWSVTGDGYEPVGTIADVTSSKVAAAVDTEIEEAIYHKTENVPLENPDLARILQIGVLCNNSKLEQEDDLWVVKGDPTEGALLSLASKAGALQEGMASFERHHEEPFDSETKIMSVVCKESNAEELYKFSKGSVEAILTRCKWYQDNGQIYPLCDKQKEVILQQNEEFAKQALRVLGFAYSNGESDDLTFVGLVGMIDPPKPEVEESIREAIELGVKPVMITGDHPTTAISIAKQTGIWNREDRVLTGLEIDNMTDEELKEVVKSTSVFARVTPAHKLRIVTAFQSDGQIVAMTGDGVNDTPAIKKANIGIAMGQTGTEVTKEAADLILKKDHFGSIVEGVKEGRTIIGNIRKAVGCLLTGNLAEVLVTSAAVIAGMPIPLVPIQILLMNLITDALPAMILAVNPGNKTKQTKRQDIVDKDLYKKVITRGVLLGVGSLAVFGISLAVGVPLPVAQTSAFAALVAGQLIQTFSWRQEGSEETIRDWSKDRFFITALGTSWLVLLSAIYVPPLARIFHTVPLTLTQWIPVLLVAGTVSQIAKPIINLVSYKNTDLVKPVVSESALLKTV
ncbi:HAD-IC family P-type ATPase [Bacillus paramycoides]|uniref:cation-translocating P-type ATPase n=1 Tax=Bacillus paramycoides TaxID=2026194 RepID=UPI003D03B60C